MKTKKQKRIRSTPAARRRREHEAEAGVAGALAGATMGAVAGPPGAVAGAVLGGAAGAVAAVAIERKSAEEAARNEQLDAEIGVIGGDLGAPNLEHPPARTGAYSSASAGAGSSGGASPAEGPMQPPES